MTRPHRPIPPVALFLLFLPPAVWSQTGPDTTHPQGPGWSLHFQQTVIVQGHPPFHSPYEGENSLHGEGETATSLTTTAFMVAAPLKGVELVINPELSGGYGMSGVKGVAGFPNGETYRIGNPKPTGYLARMFLRWTIPLSQKTDTTGGDPNHLTTVEPAERIELTAGKLSLLDVFDDNAYSHDPRLQFLNWALMGNGAWDYPADTRGYTWTFIATYNRPTWAVSLAAAMMPREANGPDFDTDLSRSLGTALELDLKEELGLPGTLRLVGFHNKGRMGSYREALRTVPPNVDSIGAVSGGRKWGFGINWEQKLGPYAGLFARAGWNDGQYQSFAFTEIDRTISAGIVLDGRLWGQEEHLLGVAGVLNGLSEDHRDYLAAGGYGFIIGDGALHYAGEAILELFYRFQLTKEIALTPDYNFIVDPAYNQDRGPVHVFGMRVHVEF